MRMENTVTDAQTDRLAEIIERTTAATPGPWKWIGNQDTHQVYLGTMMQVVLGTLDRERTPDDKRDIEQIVSWLWDSPPDDMPHFDDDHEAEYEAWVRERATEMWMEPDEWDTVPTDRRIAVRDGWTLIPLEETAVYEVCPDATDRDDPRVYRADYRRTRNADAEFIAHARADIEWLIEQARKYEHLLATVEVLETTGVPSPVVDEPVALDVSVPEYDEPPIPFLTRVWTTIAKRLRVHA